MVRKPFGVLKRISDRASDQVGDQVNGTDIQRNDRTIRAETEQAREQVRE